MNIHEYQAKKLLSKYGVAVLRGGVAYTPSEAEQVAKDLGGPVWVVKSQIHAGGRGKGKFKGHESEGGGVRVVKSVDAVRDNADACVTIPMFGFTESFNISVSVALCLYDVTMRLRAGGLAWQLTEDEKIDIYLEWLRELVRGADLLEKRFLEEQK